MSIKKRWKELIEKIEKRRSEIREEKRILNLCDKILGKERSLENIDKVIKFLFEQGFKEECIEAIVLGTQFFFSPSWLPPLDEKVIEEETQKIIEKGWEPYAKEVVGKEFIGPVLENPERYTEKERTKILATCMNFGFLLIDYGFPVRKSNKESSAKPGSNPNPEFGRLVAALFMFIKICLRSIQKSSC